MWNNHERLSRGMKTITTILTTILAVSISLAGTYSGGSGTVASPYQISNLADLAELARTSGDWGKYFIQAADVNATATQYWDDSDDNSDGDLYNDANDATSTGNNEGFNPIGKISPFFTGTYNGAGHSIDGLFIDRTTAFSGLFGETSNSTISNLGVTNVNITGKYDTGGLVGRNESSSQINNCFSTGSVVGAGYVGGLVGRNESSSQINNSYSTASVTGTDSYVGGLVGRNESSSQINNCFSTGSVVGAGYVGGLVGINYTESVINNSYSTGSVTGSGNNVGGLVGRNEASSQINNSYSTGSVEGGRYVGGLVGFNFAAITNSYSTGLVTGTSLVGGLVGVSSSASTTNSFWDIGTSGQSSSSGGTGKTTTEMKTQSTFTDASWDFTVNGEDDDWKITAGMNSGYPHLVWAEGVDSSLPVELSSFTAESKHANILLKWSTESEIENLGFVIERRDANTETETVWTELSSYLSDESLSGHGSTSARNEYAYTDNSGQAGMTYAYRLSDVDYKGQITVHKSVSVLCRAEETDVNPGTFQLSSIYPNPFNPSTTIGFEMLQQTEMKIVIYNTLGIEVWDAEMGMTNPGSYEIIWSGVNRSGEDVAAGVYFISLQTPQTQAVEKAILIK